MASPPEEALVQNQFRCVRQRARQLRRGLSVMWLILAVAVIGLALAIWQYPAMFGKSNDAQSKAETIPVKKADFAHSVIEPGEIESSNNTDIRCEVQARNSSGVMIIEIVPNGTTVQPGDFLVQFDSSALENEKTQQQVVCNNSQAMLAQSKALYETAVITKQEYLEGTNKQEEQTIQSEVFVAEENLRRAQEYAGYSERLAARGYVTGVQVEADRFAVEKARKELETAQTKLRVLKDYTSAKMLKTLDANIESAQAKQHADENSLKLEQSKLALIEAQIKKCRVISPVAGKVVYANQTGGRGSSEIIIQDGAMIRERQSVIRIPDMQNMQVTAKINETRVGFIREGMEATVRLESLPDLELSGRVTRVDELPIPISSYSLQVKQYYTYVQINNPPAGLIRPGLTAKVEIHVEKIPDTIAVPVVSVIEHSGEFYCFVKENGTVVPRWVAIGSSNDTSVVIREGLQPGDELVQNPDPFAKLAEFPKPPAGKTSQQDPLQLAKRKGDAKGSGNPSGASGKSGGFDPIQMVKALFEKYDANKDNILEGDEIPADQRDKLVRHDANSDGKLEKAELLRGMQARRKPSEATADAGGLNPGQGPGMNGPPNGPPNLGPPAGNPPGGPGPGPRTSMLPAAGGAGQ